MIPKKPRLPIVQILIMGFLPSFLKVLLYKVRGYKINKNVKIGLGSVIISDDVIIGSNTKISFGTVIRAKRLRIGRYVKIGSATFIDTNNVEIGDDAKINEKVIIGGIKWPESSIIIGKRVTIMLNSFINPTKPIIIGDDSGIGGHCLLFTHGSWLSQLDGFPVSFESITIGKKVWLPWRVFVMPGVKIGNNVVIGANSLVNQNFPSNTLIAGSPAKIIKENYPVKPSSQERHIIIIRILERFMDILTKDGIKIFKELRGEDFHLNFKSEKKIPTKIIYFPKVPNKQPNISDKSLLIIDFKEKFNFKHKAILNLDDKTRLGSNNLLESFVNYLSNFGIRFERLD